MKRSFSLAVFSWCAANFVGACAVDPNDASVAANQSDVKAGKPLVEKAFCDMDIFISTDQTRCIEYRAGKCRDYLYKGNKKEDRGEFDCSFEFISSNAEKKDRTRIKLSGGTLKYDVNFASGFQDGVCTKAKTGTDMQLKGGGRWLFWRPDQNTCKSWAGVAANEPATDQNPNDPLDDIDIDADKLEDNFNNEIKKLPDNATPPKQTVANNSSSPSGHQPASGSGGSNGGGGGSNGGGGSGGSGAATAGILSNVLNWIQQLAN